MNSNLTSGFYTVQQHLQKTNIQLKQRYSNLYIGETLVVTESRQIGNSVQKHTTSQYRDTVLEYGLVIPDVEKQSNF